MPHTRPYKLYSPLPELPLHKTWAEIDLDALRENYRRCRESVPDGQRIISVVKADAYGHGACAVARTLLEEGCDFFAVSCIDEAIPLREMISQTGKEADLLILGYTLPDQVPALVKNNIIQTVFSPEYAEEVAGAARRAGLVLRCHVKLDTGMNRIGFRSSSEEDVAATAACIERLSKDEGLRIEGLFSHFASADAEEDGGLTKMQFERFMATDTLLRQKGVRIPFRHICNSAAAIRFPKYRLEGVRFGISLYGISPAAGTDVPLSPVMRLYTVVSHIHTVRAGETVSYGATYRADSDRTLATLPIGYADGFLRAYAGTDVRIMTESGKVSAPIVGRICMDQCMVDITGLPVHVGDKVILLGDDPGDIEDLARRAGTIPYECLCLISARVPRIYRSKT
ncbi:MAG: alanine racemase [Clostridia bacterium]|nr:alanine racemase [Clostridia bacterium]